MVKQLLTVEDLEEASGMPAEDWKGNCFLMANEIVDNGLAQGRAVYGHYLGPVHEDSMFYTRSRCGFVQHGWVVDGDFIIDPTRWAFECREPYIFVGGQIMSDQYDEGGNEQRRKMMRPPPRHDPDAQQSKVEFEGDTEEIVRAMLGHFDGPFSIEQIFWLANLPIDALAPVTESVYQAINEHHRGMLPLDNRRRVLGE